MYADYYRRVFDRSLQEIIGFAKRRIVFPICSAVGIAIVLAKFGAAHLTADALLTNVAVIASVYVLVLALWFLWNFFVAVPVFLDNELGTKVTALETAENERGNKLTIRSRFARLMEEGQHLYREVGSVSGDDFRAWDDLLAGWQNAVCVALKEIEFPADCHEFMRAIDEIEPLLGVIDLRWKQAIRRRKLQKQQQKLEEIVRRRLP
jgi:hypothetical protein